MTVPAPSKFSRFGLLAAAVAIVLPLHSIHAQQTLSNINFGAAGGSGDSLNDSWAILTFGANSGATDQISSSTIDGEIGAAGTGDVTFSGVTDTFNSYYETGGIFTAKGYNGTKYSSASTNSLLSSAVTAAESASRQASLLSSAPGVAVTTSESYNAANGNNGQFVLNITNFALSNSTITLTGASNDSFVFNISGTFSLAASTIKLMGGVTASNVLFNYTGTSSISITGGTTNGIILAASTASTNQGGSSNWSSTTVNVSGGATINGSIIADKVSISGNSTVQAVVSP